MESTPARRLFGSAPDCWRGFRPAAERRADLEARQPLSRCRIRRVLRTLPRTRSSRGLRLIRPSATRWPSDPTVWMSLLWQGAALSSAAWGSSPWTSWRRTTLFARRQALFSPAENARSSNGVVPEAPTEGGSRSGKAPSHGQRRYAAGGDRPRHRPARPAARHMPPDRRQAVVRPEGPVRGLHGDRQRQGRAFLPTKVETWTAPRSSPSRASARRPTPTLSRRPLCWPAPSSAASARPA